MISIEFSLKRSRCDYIPAITTWFAVYLISAHNFCNMNSSLYITIGVIVYTNTDGVIIMRMAENNFCRIGITRGGGNNRN